ncbi:MAG: HAMP domain-containing histidine kinase [Clostridiales bacterium]|nr:HAMP domain-containing histidine kinase [Clostridiales bacterium]
MKTRSFLIFAAISLLVLVIVCFRINTLTSQRIKSYPTEINRLTIALGKDWESTKQHKKELIPTDQPFEYAVIDNDGNLLICTDQHISTSVSSATTNYDVIRDIVTEDGETVGKLLVHNDYRQQQASRNRRISIICGAVLFLMLAATLGYFIYLKKRIVDPFEKMQHFASEVAAGNLDVPIQMDRNHVFGAFTESFDIMREELRASKLREADAVKARKELVAQLSHDIKTPVTSIKAMAEVMELSAHDEEERKTIRSINAKADQIDSLVSNLFHATLEELEHLEVSPDEVTSKDIEHFISEADYKKKVSEFKIEEVVVSADPLRLNQVINNIFSNSYKYADTEMSVQSRVEKGVGGTRFLVIEIGDHGGGVPEAELDTIFGKYKRGSNAGEKDGAGLGLYISRYLMEKMGGEITATNQDGGLLTTLRLRLL